SRRVVTGSRTRSRKLKCRYASSARRRGSIAAAVPSSPSTGSASRVRRYEPPSPIRSRKRRYSMKQPSAMCCPLSGGGSGSPSGLDPVERLAVQTGERADAERAAAVERLEQAQPLGEIGPCPLGLEGHQLPELR